MTDFNITIEKIARKWVTLKVQNKKDSTKYYTGYALKDNLFKIVQEAKIGDVLHVYANCHKVEDSFKTRFEFDILLLAISTNEKANTIMAELLSNHKFTRADVNDARIHIHYENEHCYDTKLEELFKDATERAEKIAKEKAERYWHYIIDNYNDGEGYIYENGIDMLHKLSDYSHDAEIEEMKRVISAKEKRRKDELEEQERIEAERKRAELEAQTKKFFDYKTKKEIGEVLQEDNFYYRVTKVTEKCTVFDDDGIKVEGSQYDYTRLHEFDTMNYDYQYDYTYRHDVEVVSKEEYETLKAVQDAEKEQKRLQKEAEEIKEKNITEKLHSLVYYINHEMTLITEDTNRSELESNNVFFEFSKYEIILAKNKIFVVESEANINLLEESHIHDTRNYHYRGYETDYKSKFLENLKEFLKLTENANAISVIDTAIANNNERIETMQTLELEEKNVQSTAQNIAEKSLDEATKIIKNTLSDIKSSYIQLGSVLYQVNTEKLYKQKYRTFAEYCTAELDIKKRQAYNYIKVFEKYGNSQEELKDYSFTQLNLLANADKSAEDVITNYPAGLSKRELENKLKNVQSTGQKENVHLGAQKKISISSEENSVLVKALELLQQQEENANIQNLLKKLKG